MNIRDKIKSGIGINVLSLCDGMSGGNIALKEQEFLLKDTLLMRLINMQFKFQKRIILILNIVEM